MTPEERIDAALDLILRENGGRVLLLSDKKLERMREIMRKIMVDSYIQGSHDARDAMKEK